VNAGVKATVKLLEGYIAEVSEGIGRVSRSAGKIDEVVAAVGQASEENARLIQQVSDHSHKFKVS